MLEGKRNLLDYICQIISLLEDIERLHTFCNWNPQQITKMKMYASEENCEPHQPHSDSVRNRPRFSTSWNIPRLGASTYCICQQQGLVFKSYRVRTPEEVPGLSDHFSLKIKRFHSHPGCKPLVKKCHWRTERVRNDDLRSHDFPRHSTIFLYF